MKFLTCFFLVISALVLRGAPPTQRERAVKLDAIKRDFPAHTAGPINDQSKPDIAICYFEIKRAVLRIGSQTISNDFEDIRQDVVYRISRAELVQKIAKDSPATANSEEAINLSWLKTKVRPYLKQIEALVEAR